ncbi:hypothetical protein AWM70_18530 [Paenibacillus yonginensis]|uniref:Uncharacterized protein n=1 Tax=Paenibacillus yonginensis TaxID=1462996 RepID=A0A1B1N4F2_9BACL|nr:hypothetical protein [Paenibacillus yonginensis]ANS76321.1 hypothetical protein AWM70_18530 [Paenibacillus yonginensis]
MTYIRIGWSSAVKQLPIAILLFLYRLLWSVFLYKIIHSAIFPVLQRYPDSGPGELSRLLFLVEGQIGLAGNRQLHLFGGLLAGMMLIRLLLTPLIRSGIYHGLLEERDRDGAGWLFFEGIRKRWKPVSLFYLIELVLGLAPAYWLVPSIYNQSIPLLNGDHHAMWWIGAALASWGAWFFLVKKLLEYALLGWISGTGLLPSLLWCIRRLVQVIWVSLLLGGLSLLVCGLFTASSWIWTGMLGLVLHQAYPLIGSFLGIWQTASQFHLWKTGAEK